MELILGLLIIYGTGKLLFGRPAGRVESRKDREKQTFFKYPEGGYGLDNDPVMDELFFIDIMEDDH